MRGRIARICAATLRAVPRPHICPMPHTPSLTLRHWHPWRSSDAKHHSAEAVPLQGCRTVGARRRVSPGRLAALMWSVASHAHIARSFYYAANCRVWSGDGFCSNVFNYPLLGTSVRELWSCSLNNTGSLNIGLFCGRILSRRQLRHGHVLKYTLSVFYK